MYEVRDMMYDKTMKKRVFVRLPKGFSLGELLIVIAIVALLAIVIIMAYQHQVAKAHDAKRLDHLATFRVTFEDYYNDHGCYPSKEMWDNECTCDGNCLTPYMNSFFCDPVKGSKYYYYPFTGEDGVTPDPCKGYRLYTKLDDESDSSITTVGCSPTGGCGSGALASYNYGIAMGGSLYDGTAAPATTTTPTVYISPGCASAGGPHACDKGGTCNGFDVLDFSNGRCSVGFATGQCCINTGCPASIRCNW